MSGPVIRARAVGWRRVTTSATLAAALTITGLGIVTSPTSAETPPGLTGPAAWAVMHALTDGEIMRCFDRQAHEINCQPELHSLHPQLFYGDANGRGPNTDVLAIIFYQGDPTGNTFDLRVSYFRLEGGRYRYVRSYPNVGMGDLAPGTKVVFGHGQVSFVGLTLQPGDSRLGPTGRTRYVLDLR